MAASWGLLRLLSAGRRTAGAGVVAPVRPLCSTVASAGSQKTIDDVDLIRDISGLRPALKKRLRNEIPSEPDRSRFPWTDIRKWRRRLYAAHGSRSGIDPSLSWPSSEELQEIIRDREEWEPTLQEMMSKVEAERKTEKDFLRKRMAHIDQQIKKMPQFIKEYEARKAKRDLEVKKREEKQQKLLDEAREFYGYKVDVRDAKFKALVEERAAKEEAERKQQKKLQKQNRLISSKPAPSVPGSASAAQPAAAAAKDASAPSS